MDISKIIRWIRQLINDQEKPDGYEAFEFDTDNIFSLSEDFIDEDSITVFKNGTEISDLYFSFDPDSNQVEINLPTGDELVKEDLIEIKYSYFAKYSNTEIAGYIEGSLLYFVEFRYKKIFEVNSESKVVAINDSNPTTEEGYMIALVTSVHIRPDNKVTRIPDITISGSQNKSKKDQIAEIITRWTSFVGSLSFLEKE